MSCCGWWAVLNSTFLATAIQLAVFAVLSWTLYVLIGYAKDTKRTAAASERMAEAAATQIRNMQRPLLALSYVQREFDVGMAFEHADEGNSAGARLEGSLTVRNVGGGVAYDVHMKVLSSIGAPLDIHVPHIEAGDSWNGARVSTQAIKALDRPTALYLEYRGVAGAYRSIYELTPSGREFVITKLTVQEVSP